MSNQLSPELLAQLYGQESNDPFLMLLTLNHASFSNPIRLVNNSVDVVSNGNTFIAFPMRIRLPVDDGESLREITLDLDNVSLDLISPLRSVTTAIDVNLQMVLGSIPDTIQMEFNDLKIQSINYTKTRIQARLAMDSFLNTEMTSERYGPTNFPGLF